MLLKFAIQDFMDDRKFKNLREETLEGYLKTLDQFHEFCVEREVVRTDDITPGVVKAYLTYCMEERGNKPGTINHKLHNIKIFCNYLEECGVYDEKTNPIKKINYVETEVDIRPFSEYQIKKMLNYYRRLNARDKQFYSYRDYVLILVFLGTGARVGEVVNMKWDDIDWKNNLVLVKGKQRHPRPIPIVDKLKKELAEYYTYVKQEFKEPSEYVFTNRFNKPLTRNAIQNIFKRLKDIMAFKNVRLSAHTFRHTFAYFMVLNGVDPFTLQKMLGHKKLDMTMRYVNLFGGGGLNEQNEKFNPLNTISI